uniref:hypothetical protein n=1 Tax=Leptolyngbya sp. NIES-2104 TaxID=1552121 RepID=UPI000AC40545|nr:hypothetical protein [Leptolyngbya sp. NIES-2104]
MTNDKKIWLITGVSHGLAQAVLLYLRQQRSGHLEQGTQRSRRQGLEHRAGLRSTAKVVPVRHLPDLP